VLGTAFFTSKAGEFVTAAHVLSVTNVKTASGCIPGIYLPTSGWSTEVRSIEIRHFAFRNCPIVNETLDIAVCRTVLDMSTFAGIDVVPVTFNDLSQPDGTAVAFTGFPLQSRQPLTSRGSIAAYRGGVGVLQGELVLDRTGWPGLSGGPVYTADGAVIGIVVQRGTGDGAGITIARPSRFVAQIKAAPQPQPGK
jgi:S1-C subfamily serine protease